MTANFMDKRDKKDMLQPIVEDNSITLLGYFQLKERGINIDTFCRINGFRLSNKKRLEYERIYIKNNGKLSTPKTTI